MVKRGKSLATLRERVERQRSVTSSANHGSESNSLEGLNLERGDSNYKSRCVEQLDNQVSSLHQDVAALSVEVNIPHTHSMNRKIVQSKKKEFLVPPLSIFVISPKSLKTKNRLGFAVVAYRHPSHWYAYEASMAF